VKEKNNMKTMKKALLTSAMEEGIQKAVELGIVGAILGISLSSSFLAVAGVMGGSVRCQTNPYLFGGKIT
jgi:hypothetical protein